MSMVEPINLSLQVSTDSDDETLDEITRQLVGELKSIDVESVSLLKENISPKGAKAVDAVTIGALMVVVLPAILPQLISFLREWAARADNRTVKIKRQEGKRSIEVEYDMNNISEKEIKRMLRLLGGFVKNA